MSNSRHNPAYLHLLQSFQQSKTHLSISNLNNPLLTKNPKIFSSFLQKATIKLQTTKKLTGLTLNLQGVQLDPRNINEIYTLLFKRLRNIESLKIIFCSNSDLQNLHFKILLKALNHFRNLKTFEITIAKMLNEVSLKANLVNLINTLKRSVPRLNNAKFIFTEGIYGNIDPKGFFSFKNCGIQRLHSLKSLSLQLPRSVFINTEISPKGKLDLSALNKLRNLKSLEVIAIDLVNDYRGSITKKLGFDPKKVFPKLKRFKWGVLQDYSTKIKGLEILGQEIAAQLKGLEDFELRFKQNTCEIIDREIEETARCLSALNVDLKRLSLIFNIGKLTSNTAKAFLAALSSPRLKTIETLSLEFVGCQGLNNSFVNKLGEIIGKNMNGVKALRLHFGYHNSSSTGSFTKNLLALVGYEGLTDRAIHNLGASLAKQCQKLELVSLEFGYWSQVSDKGVESLCESLRKIEGLKRIRLRFRFCSQVSKLSVTSAVKKFGLQRDLKFALI